MENHAENVYQRLFPDFFLTLINNPKKPLHARDSFKEGYQKALKKLITFFLSNPVPFNGQICLKQNGPGTSDHSLFRLQSKFRKIPLLVIYIYIYYLIKFIDKI